MRTEIEIWNHYRDYLMEATGKSASYFGPVLSKLKERVYMGCSRRELRELMDSLFEPVTIMQSLEQWQNQMDILLYTPVQALFGLSREEYYSVRQNKSPYVMEHDSVLDDPDPATPIRKLSSVTQDLLHIASERSGRKAPALIVEIQKKAGLQKNWEIQMLLGDCYRQSQQFKESLAVYNMLWDDNGGQDLSIQEAISFTRFAMEQGEKLFEKQFDEWAGDFRKFKSGETVRRSSPKISRNAPCPCGSGKKHKNCCGRNT